MASTATQKGNRGQRMAVDVLKKWTHKKMKSSSQFGMGGFNFDPHKGDILCYTEGHFFPFTVEVKFYKDINFCQLLQPNLKNVMILDFWDQVAGDAKICKKVPMLMMRFNGLPSDFFFVVIETDFWEKVNIFHRALNIRRTITFWEMDKGLKLKLIGSDQFFKINYKEVKKVAKEHIKTLYR